VPEPPTSPTRFKNGLRRRESARVLAVLLLPLAAHVEHGVLPAASSPSALDHDANLPYLLFIVSHQAARRLGFTVWAMRNRLWEKLPAETEASA